MINDHHIVFDNPVHKGPIKAANALQLRFRFMREKQIVPPPLLLHYPQLRAIARSASAPGQGDLFGADP